MALITLRQLLDHAAEHSYGVPAFNINNLEQIKAIMEACNKTDSPVIIQASKGARKYAGDTFIRHLIAAAVTDYPHIPICLHQDHGNNFQTCLSAMQNGFTSVMMDGSLEEDGKSIASFEYNVNATNKVVESAHLLGVSVEGELGCLGSLETGEGEKEDGHGFEGKLSREQLLTDPDEAAEFVKKTNVDALAVAIGTSHGAYKFTRKPDGDILALDVIKKINQKMPTLHLVMHGSSSVPQELQDIFNEYGGEMPQTFGVPLEEIATGIKNGVRKVNIDTDNRMAIIGQYRKIAHQNPGEFDPRKFNVPAITKMKELCIERFEAFNTAGQAQKIKPIPTEIMALRYASDELNQKIL